jgi:fumarate reductase subunit D
MAEQFINYRSYNDKAVAVSLYDQLTKQGIPVQWEDSEGFFDASFANYEFLNLYYIKLLPADFKRADEILLKSINESGERPAEDYYLFSFNNDELRDVLKKPDEWNEFDIYWAEKILSERGVQVKKELLVQDKIERLNELKKPWQLDKLWIVCAVGLCLAALIFPDVRLAAGVMFVGGYISFSKKTIPDGQRVPAFSSGDRSFGKLVFLAGIVLAVYHVLIYIGVANFTWPF